MTATIHYAFHALRGLELAVVHRSREADGVVHVVAPDGFELAVPEWMLRPEADEVVLSEQPEILGIALIRAADLLRLAARALDEVAPSDSVDAGSYRGGKPRRHRCDSKSSTSSSIRATADQTGRPDAAGPARTKSRD